MGGKDKKGPRTKGNMKPSSSGRSAELLGHAPIFVGFGGLTETPCTSAVVSHFPTEESELAIPAEFRLALKKMSKKDATTKIKALQEFKDQCEVAPTEVLKCVVPFWPRIFTRLTVDADRRVRENVHKAHSSFAAKLGRNLAPILKEIMGAWFTSQCDIHAPAASCASHSLSSRFPEAKLSDALVFCHAEIMDYIWDSLFKEDDYSEEQKERIVVGALAGYSLLLQEIDITKILNNEVNANRHMDFWKSDKKLYKLVNKESDATIKTTWFSTIYNLLYFLPQIAQDNAPKLFSSVFSFLDDKESMSMPSLWETILKLLLTIDKPSSYANFPTHLVPRFLNLLENAFYGNANKIGPLTLPIVKILRDNSQHKERLDRQIVEAFCAGITNRTCASYSAMEASAISTSLFQCLDHMIKTNQSDSIITDLFETVIIPFTDRLIKSSCSDLVLVAVVRQTALSLDDWFFNDIPASLAIWNQFEGLMESVLSQSIHPDKNAITQRIGLICSTFLDPNVKFDSNLRKPSARAVRVRFNEPNNQDNHGVPAVSSPPVMTPARVHSERFRDKVVELSVRMCRKALECEEAQECYNCMNLLVVLMHHDQVSQGFLALDATSPIDMISLHIQPMLRRTPGRDTASLLFTFIDAVNPDQRLELLDGLIQDEEICVALATTALENFSHKNSVVDWLSGSQIAALLRSVAEQLITFHGIEKIPSLCNLLRASLLSRKSQGLELVLPDGHLIGILNVFTEYLGKSEVPLDDSLDQFVQSLAKIWKFTTEEIHYLEAAAGFRDAVIAFLCSSDRLELDSAKCLLEIWYHSASVAIKPSCLSAFKIMKRKLLAEDLPEILLERIILVFNRLVNLWSNDHSEELLTLTEQAIPTSSEWASILLESDAPNLMAKEILNGNYIHKIPVSCVGFRPVQMKGWSSLVKMAFFVSSVAVQCPFPEKKISELVSYLLYSMVAGELLCGLTNRQYQDENLRYIARLNESLKTNFETILTNCSAHDQLLVVSEIEDICSRSQWIWTFAIKKVAQWRCKENQESGVKLITGEESEQNRRNEPESLCSQVAELNSFSHENWGDSRQLLATIRLNLLQKDQALSSFDSIDCLIRHVQMWQKEYNEDFLFSTDLKTTVGTETAWTVVEIIRLLAVAVELHPHHLIQSSWDFILCSMSSWCSSLSDSWDLEDIGASKATAKFSSQNISPLLLSFSIALCRLVKSCASIIGQMEQNPLSSETSFSLPPNLKSEWNDIFSEVAFGVIERLFYRLSKKNRTKVPDQVFDFLVEAVSFSLHHIPLQHVKSSIDQLSPHLLAKQPAVQFAAYTLVKKLLPAIASTEESDLKEDEDGKDMERRPAQALLSVLEKVSLPSLEEIRIGDLHTFEPYSSECIQLVGFCLTWDLILSLCGHSSSLLRYQYAAYLTNSGLMTELMDKLFCIIPHATRQQPVELDFTFHSDATVTESFIQDLAAKVYSSALRYLPAVVRRWCNNTDKRTASLVEKFTSRCVSPALCASDLQFSTKTWDNMTVRVRSSAREVIATYKLNEEGSMELVIQLPTNYPLGNITVETGRKVGVTSSQWRNWMLQLTTFLMHQNGSILDGLVLWKRNVDKRFEGVEECYICYYVLHGTNYQLPKLQCRTCRKKFHADCLYKWFSTSNNSTCPLCRNLF